MLEKSDKQSKKGDQRFATVTNRPDIYQNFYDNISQNNDDFEQLFDPWQMRNGLAIEKNRPRSLTTSDNDYVHRNHLHISLKPSK